MYAGSRIVSGCRHLPRGRGALRCCMHLQPSMIYGITGLRERMYCATQNSVGVSGLCCPGWIGYWSQIGVFSPENRGIWTV